MTAFYNELDRYPAAWLRNLAAAGRIAPGVVDERSICDLTADDVRGHRQAHYFAGLGGWSLALRLAGVPDDADIWTGSCPCQPLSVAGLQRGHEDHRHLWPVWHRLIAECRPPVILGEQVGGPVGRAWLTAVRADLEDLGYAVGAADLAAASVGAPHIRQRIFFGAVRGVGLADTDQTGWIVEWRQRLLDRERASLGHDADGCGEAGGRCCERDCACWDTGCFHRKHGHPIAAGERYMCGRVADRKGSGWPEGGAPCVLAARGDGARPAYGRGSGLGLGLGLGLGHPARVEARPASRSTRRAGADGGRLGLAIGNGAGRNPGASPGPQAEGDGAGLDPRRVGDLVGPPGGNRGPWDDAELIACHDPKRGLIYRPAPTDPRIPVVAHARRGGHRVAKLRAGGNAIVSQVAAAFVSSFLEAVAEMTL